MRPVAWVRSVAPDWAIVVGVAAIVGAVSAILSIAVYRDLVLDSSEPVSVELTEMDSDVPKPQDGS